MVSNDTLRPLHFLAYKPPGLHISYTASGKVDDVITASAKTLWHLEYGTEDKFIAYLKAQVFLLSET